MKTKEARVLNHKMHKHIHDDRILCGKCEATGYLSAIEKAELVVEALKEANGFINKIMESKGKHCEEASDIIERIEEALESHRKARET